jgi:hypothetical protein
MEKTNTRGTTGATGVVVALEPVSKMAADIIVAEHWAATSVSFDLADACSSALTWWIE